jgi:DNA-binding CsgD family transcriptional regulator
MAAYQEAGAAGDAGRVRSRLRSLGVRRRHWRQAVRPVCGWESLTDTEHSVAGLVAEGLTNRQVAGRMFLSPHTIDFHLRQIFRKLDIGSRVELTRQVVERDSEGVPEPSAVPV